MLGMWKAKARETFHLTRFPISPSYTSPSLHEDVLMVFSAMEKRNATLALLSAKLVRTLVLAKAVMNHVQIAFPTAAAPTFPFVIPTRGGVRRHEYDKSAKYVYMHILTHSGIVAPDLPVAFDNPLHNKITV